MKGKSYLVQYMILGGNVIRQRVTDKVDAKSGEVVPPNFKKIFKDVVDNGLYIEEKNADGSFRSAEFHNVVSAKIKMGKEEIVDIE